MAEKLDFHSCLQFLEQLKRNNNRQWFEKNKEEYQLAAEQFASLIGRLITQLGKIEDLEGVTPKDCIMRIYRDVRFSKDKSPYKTGFGAGIAPGGRKSGRLGYHIHLAPNGASMIAGGLWEPTPQQLSKFRDAIDKDASDFKRILANNQFKRHFGQVTGDRLKTAPKGYPADHPDIDLLRYKQVCASEKFSDKIVVTSEFPDLLLASIKAMKPFIDYLNQVALR
jgi:uncharacterized protein (TIGR02453 family)